MRKILTICFILLFATPTAHANDFTIIKEGGMTKKEFSRIDKSSHNNLSYYSKLGFSVPKHIVVIPKSKKWMNKTLSKLGCQSGLEEGSWALDCKTYTVFTPNTTSPDFYYIMAHEAFHMWQLQYKGNYPQWFWEGSATYFGREAYNSWGKSKLPTSSPYLDNKCSTQNWAEMEIDCSYYKGSHIVHRIIKDYGLEFYRKLYTENNGYFYDTFYRLSGLSFEAYMSL